MAADPAWVPISNLTLDGSRLLMGTHEGFWQQNAGEQATLLSEPAFDVTRLVVAPLGLLASGHSGPAWTSPLI